MIESSRSFVKRFIDFSLGPILSIAIGFVSVPVITWLVVPSEFGKAAMFTLAFSIVSIMLYLGLDVAFAREFNSTEDKGNLYWNSIYAPLSLSVIFSFILLANQAYFSNLLFGSEQELVMRSLAISLPFAVISRFNMLVVRMQERGKVYSGLTVLQQVSKFVITVILLLLFSKTFKFIVIGQVCAIIIQTIVSTFYIKSYWRAKKNIKWDILRTMFLFGLPLIPTAIIEWLFNGFDKVALRKWSDFSQIGIYSAGFKIAALLSILKTAFSTFWTPTMYRWHETGVELSKFQLVNNILTSGMYITATLVVLFRYFIVKILSGNYYSAIDIIPFLLFLPLMLTIKTTTATGIFTSRKTYFILIIISIATIVNIVLNWLLVPKFEALGAAIATAFAMNVNFWLNTIFSRKVWSIKLSFRRMIINNILFAGLASITLLHIFFAELMLALVIIAYNVPVMILLYKKIGVKQIISKYLITKEAR